MDTRVEKTITEGVPVGDAAPRPDSAANGESTAVGGQSRTLTDREVREAEAERLARADQVSDTSSGRVQP
jgi:hypothetical protein